MNTDPHHPNQRCCRRDVLKLGGVGGLGLVLGKAGLAAVAAQAAPGNMATAIQIKPHRSRAHRLRRRRRQGHAATWANC